MVPEHYWEDGTCKCNAPEHRKMIKIAVTVTAI
jgi:hypothetical protein